MLLSWRDRSPVSYFFNCPSCGTEVSGTAFLDGRRVRCPECDTVVTPSGDALGTVKLEPREGDQDETVILQPVEITDAIPAQQPLEVTDAVEAIDAVPVVESEAPTAGSPPVEAPKSPPVGERHRGEAKKEFRRMETPPRQISEAEMDMTPMVDVTFLLLIFFMVTATFTMQKSLEIPKNTEDDPSTTVVEVDRLEQSDFVTVLVDQFNTYQVVTVDWEREAPSEQDLHAMLREARSGDSTGTVPTKLRVEAHGDSLHQRVVAAIDAGSANGFEEVLLASVFDE